MIGWLLVFAARLAEVLGVMAMNAITWRARDTNGRSVPGGMARLRHYTGAARRKEAHD